MKEVQNGIDVVEHMESHVTPFAWLEIKIVIKKFIKTFNNAANYINYILLYHSVMMQ